MCEHKFFRCNHCGNFIGTINDTGVSLVCCDEKMEELVANTVDASKEKHMPEVTIADDVITVQVGSTIHPMLEEHHIEFIYLQTEHGGQRKCIKVGKEPVVSFKVIEDKPVSVYAYCNIHGLWRTIL